MNKSNIHTLTVTHPGDVRSDTAIRAFDLKTSHRLLVLMPANFDYNTVTQRIWELARATGSTIQLLGLSDDAEQEMALRRDLITMSALIRSASILVSATVKTGTDWVDAVRHIYQSGDMIVCMSGQRTGFLRRPLAQVVESTLQAPVYILSELHPPPSRAHGLSQVLAWTGSLAIITGFLILQIKLHQPANNWTTLMELISTAFEFWLIWVWNNLFR